MFFSYKDESLRDTYIKFTLLISDLEVVNVTYSNFEMVNKFIDSLPPNWKTTTAPLKISNTLKKFDMAALYGTLMNHEKAEAMLEKILKLTTLP